MRRRIFQIFIKASKFLRGGLPRKPPSVHNQIDVFRCMPSAIFANAPKFCLSPPHAVNVRGPTLPFGSISAPMGATDTALWGKQIPENINASGRQHLIDRLNERGRRSEPLPMRMNVRKALVQEIFIAIRTGHGADKFQSEGRPYRETQKALFRKTRASYFDRPAEADRLDEIDKPLAHRGAPEVGGYKSGRSSWRGTPVTRSTSSTRRCGTLSHCERAWGVMCNLAANSAALPTALMARPKARLWFLIPNLKHSLTIKSSTAS